MLVLPSVSIGNVPQLALDLLIHTYGFEVVKSLDDRLLCPFIGPVDYLQGSEAKDGISTAAELYKLGDHYLVQLRSPPLTGRKKGFLESLAKQLPEPALDGEILVVGSANAGMDETVAKEPDSTRRFTELTAPRALPEAGFVNEALTTFPHSEALVGWVYEGDNFSDSALLARKIAQKLRLPEKPFKQPVSWSRVYGKDIPVGIEQGLYT